MLNYFLDNYPEQKAKQQNDSSLAKIKKLFMQAGIVPAITFTTNTGMPVSGISTYSFGEETGKIKLLGLLPDKNMKSGNIIIHLDTSRHVYDIRKNEYLGKGKDVTINVEAWVPAMLALLPGTIDAINADALHAIEPGGKIKLRFFVQVSGSMKLNSIASVAVYDPSGKKISYYGSNCNIINNEGEFEFSTALNDKHGTWRIEIREVISGKKLY